MWIETKFKLREDIPFNKIAIKGKDSVLEVTNGPDKSIYCMVTVKPALTCPAAKKGAFYDSKNHSFSINGMDITSDVIAFSEEKEGNPYFNGRVFERFHINQETLSWYDIVGGGFTPEKLSGMIASYTFNNITAEAVGDFAVSRFIINIYSYPEYVIKGNNSKYLAESIPYNGPMYGLKQYMVRCIDYSAWVRYPETYKNQKAEENMNIDCGGYTWHVCLQEVINNTVSMPNNAPKKNGDYLCTCVNASNQKFLKVLKWDENHWTLPGPLVVPPVLAWTDDIEVCGYDDFQYNCGAYLTKKEV